MAEKVTSTVDVNKLDGKPVVEFSPEFKSSFDKSISAYDEALDQLQSLVNGNGFDEYGICNCCYNLRYITPSDISEYISNLFKAISMKLIACDIADLEKFSVEMAKQFIEKNSGKAIYRDNILGLSTYSDPRNETLMDLLVQTENTFFDRCVYSKFEMEKRAKDAKEDYNKINNMHFGAAMKAVVNNLPSVIKKAMTENSTGFVCCSCDTVMTYIETFILFACGLNTCMLSQMIGYCEPMSSYLRKEKATVTQESVSTRGNKPVYVVLVSGTNIVSETIKKFTHSKWSHAAISFDPSLEYLYSYTFATTEYAPASQGLRRESIKMLNNIGGEICVYGFYAPNKTVKDMKQAIDDRIKSGQTKYDLGLLVKKAFKDEAVQSADKNKKICSAFVNSIIEEFIGKISDKNSPSPDDMFKALESMDSHEFVKLYEGPCTTYDDAAVTTRLKKFAKEAETKTFSEYVSEFCLVKTNDMNIRSRIPFDFNMRNIVLQDCTPNFKDTRSALHFMLKDNRSPIHAMVLKDATTNKIPNPSVCNPALQMFEPYFHPPVHDGPLGFEYDRVGFLTDVNWLDKIAYGNNFMDGNYRMDSVGNENRHPIYVTLQMLHKMYCGCALKTNEEIADNILKIAGVMLAVIGEQPWTCYNKDLVKDILAVLGECFTRNVIKLYNNHCTIITYSDDMDDTMIPGYTYCEAFVYMEAEQAGEKPAPPTVTFADSNGKTINTAAKTGALNRITTIMRQFSDWIQKKLAQIPALFQKINGAKAAYVTQHQKLNDQIFQAITNKQFNPQFKNFPLYKIPLKEIVSKTGAVQQILDDYARDPNKEINVVEIKSAIYPGSNEVAKSIAEMNDEAKETEAIKNYVLFSDTTPDQHIKSFTGPLAPNVWKDIVGDLSNAQRLVDEAGKAMTQSLQNGMKTLEKIRKNEETAAQKQNIQQEADGVKSPASSNCATLLKIFQQVAKIYQINVMNAITNTFFNTYYQAYKQIVDAFQTQTKNAAVQGNQQQNANNAANDTTNNPTGQQTGATNVQNANKAATVPM